MHHTRYLILDLRIGVLSPHELNPPLQLFLIMILMSAEGAVNAP